MMVFLSLGSPRGRGTTSGPQQPAARRRPTRDRRRRPPCPSSPSRRPPQTRPNGSPATSSSTPSPAARNPHAVGQTLYVTEGRGLVQSRGGPVEEIRAGDIITTPPDQWHWHGAAPDHYMTHLSITEAPGDQRPETDWGEHVTDDEYPATSAPES